MFIITLFWDNFFNLSLDYIYSNIKNKSFFRNNFLIIDSTSDLHLIYDFILNQDRKYQRSVYWNLAHGIERELTDSIIDDEKYCNIVNKYLFIYLK